MKIDIKYNGISCEKSTMITGKGLPKISKKIKLPEGEKIWKCKD